MSSTTLGASATLLDTVFPVSGNQVQRNLRQAALAVGFSLFIAASARISIPLPFTPVPITGQTFAVLLTGAALGARLACVTLLLYLLEGAAGLPVFAGGAAGYAKFAGPTGGYLLSYPAAAFLMGTLASRGWDRTPARTFAAMLISSGVVLTAGTCWLAFFVGGFGKAAVLGLLPFLPGDCVKAGLASLSLPAAWKLTRRRP